ncbi:AraC family transcriptional regulator [Vibrio profundum]|uniref:helix-turn-helix domain-containing protein n=1 Tax=Vibrio profundum TaxID=2910247 RepID=UPI003D0F01EC
MKTSLSIRAYTKQLKSHVHGHYHQLVLPIQGKIDIDTAGYVGKVTVGECVVISAGVPHAFKANEAARFIVVDLDRLPDYLLNEHLVLFSVSSPMLSFLHFVEKQLEYQVDSGIEASIVNVFYMLLEQQESVQLLEPRIRAVQEMIAEQYDRPLTITDLSKAACLSPTQFKKVFKDNLGMSVHKYITEHRMEKAKALLTHTDLPVQIIADKVGYSNLSAFSRRFSLHFGMSPREFARS